MEICTSCPSISEEDLRAARKELKTYVDITEEDLLKIYVLAVRHARIRRATMIVVHGVMTKDVVAVRPDTGLREAAQLLAENRITGMPVTDDQKHVLGVISSADISPEGRIKENLFGSLARRLGLARAEKGGEERVGDVMSKPPITTLPDADIKEVAAILDMRRIKRLPVVDDQGKLVGIISRGDIIRAMGKK